jgi:hypothetical protein
VGLTLVQVFPSTQPGPDRGLMSKEIVLRVRIPVTRPVASRAEMQAQLERLRPRRGPGPQSSR